MKPDLIEVALRRADEAIDGARPPIPAAPAARRAVAIGDPQAPAEKFFAILEYNGLLSEAGWLDDSVRLVSIGDHFDYGGFEQRDEAARSGLRILSWLAAHAPEQAAIVAGNHDLSRVAELWEIDDVTFQQAASEAHDIYTRRPFSESEQASFLQRHPIFPSVEVAARDLSTFRVEQRTLVRRLLLEKRFRFAVAEGETLLVHAGATSEHLQRAGVELTAPFNETSVALALNACLERAVDAWDGASCFQVPGFFRAGSSKDGEPGGFLFHRPAWLDDDRFVPPKDRKRRFDPRRLPRGLVQVVGHVRDDKCRSLLGPWVVDTAPDEGRLRSLWTDGDQVEYRASITEAATQRTNAGMLFIDGGMNHTPVERYQLLDLLRLQPLVRDV